MSSLVVTLVKEYMTPSVISVSPEAPLDLVLERLRQNDISCVLVASSEGGALGVVSMTDLLRASQLKGGRGGVPIEVLPPTLHARDVMRAPVHTVRADAPVSEAASILHANRVHRLFVTFHDAVVGVFSTRDAMRVVRYLHITKPLRDVMTTPVLTIGIGDSIDAALERLDDRNLHGVVVVDGKRPVGVFTQHEAIRARSLPAELRARDPVEEVISYEAITLDASTPLHRAAAQAAATRARRIFVTDDHALVGLVSGYDLARVLIDA